VIEVFHLEKGLLRFKFGLSFFYQLFTLYDIKTIRFVACLKKKPFFLRRAFESGLFYPNYL